MESSNQKVQSIAEDNSGNGKALRVKSEALIELLKVRKRTREDKTS